MATMRTIPPSPISPLNEGPYSPPDSILSQLPPLSTAGPHLCNNHHYPNLNQNPTWVCSRCPVSTPSTSLHPLPCGHTLCSSCLSHISTTAHARITQPLVRAHMNHLLARAGRLASTWPFPRDSVLALVLEAHRLAGLTCCGRRMDVSAHVLCLERPEALRLWLALAWLAQVPATRRVCGWPDCRALIPEECEYASTRAEAHGGIRYYCPSCGGNSLPVGGTDGELREGMKEFPFLEVGAQVLVPAR